MPRGRQRTVEEPDQSLVCPICNESGMKNEDSALVEKGLKTVIDHSANLSDGVYARLVGKESARMHKTCRHQYVYGRGAFIPKKVPVPPLPSPPLLRSQASYDEKNDCLVCGLFLDIGKAKRSAVDKRDKIQNVEKHTLRTSLLDKITQRGPNDEWGQAVLARLSMFPNDDLPAAEAKYHKSCYDTFRLGGSLTDPAPVGRPVGATDAVKEVSFKKICDFLDAEDDCQFSIEKLEEVGGANDDPLYCRSWLKQRLEKHYGDAISITDGFGTQSAIVNFTGFVEKLLHDNWYRDKKRNEEEERLRIVRLAAQFILEDVRKSKCRTDVYNAPSDVTGSLPRSLEHFMETLVTSKARSCEGVKRKREALGQALMYAARPKSYIPPLICALSTDLHNRLGCRDEIDILNRCGLAVSYHEVKRHEYNLALFIKENEGNACAELRAPRAKSDYVYDNFDHNTGTIDGHDTMHVLGGQRIVTLIDPAAEVKVDCIPRLVLPKSANQIAQDLDHSMKILWLRGPVQSGLKSVLVQPMTSSLLSWDSMGPSPPAFVTAALTLDTLWMAGRWSGALLSTPSWLGFMKQAMAAPDGRDFPLSRMEALPFVELAATDPNAINTALHFAKKDSLARGQNECSVTFDQPLFIKAMKLVTMDPRLSGVHVRLGGFHLAMSFLGAIGHLMGGSGLDELFAQVYAVNSVKHMVTGKAWSRAVRAHSLAQEALGCILLDKLAMHPTTKKDIQLLYEGFLANKVRPEDVAKSEVAVQLTTAIVEIGEEEAKNSYTGKLWWQYYKLVALLRFFIRAERTGDWALHKECVKAMLPIFHAAGHVPYARAAHLYVQQMEELRGEFAEAASKGFFTVRRTNDFWAGVWTDMIIEQCLMRAMKVRGGLTRRSLTQSSIAQWILARRALIDVSAAVEWFCRIFRSSSEQHVDLRVTQQERDQRDLKKFLDWLKKYSPFEDRGLENQRVRCLHTGELGATQVNCHNAVEIGTVMMEKIIGKDFETVKLTLKGRVIPLSTSAPPHKAKAVPEVDTQFLFNKMVTLDMTQADLRRFLTYELASLPPSLFDKGNMRHNNKAALTRKFQPGNKNDQNDSLFEEPNADEEFGPSPQTKPTKTVLDGGHLLHSVPWPKHEGGKEPTYGDVCDKYVERVQESEDPSVVFDGYEESWSTKWETQQRRAGKKKYTIAKYSVSADEKISPNCKRDDFLSIAYNKSGLIELLSRKLLRAGVVVLHARADADVKIAMTAMALDQPGEVVNVVARDTDVVAILIARARDDTRIIVTKPGTKTTADEVFKISAIRSYLKKEDLLPYVLFGHAMSGCDTTSAIYGKGKLTVWNSLKKNAHLREAVAVFNNPHASKQSIAKAGEMFILSLYSCAVVCVCLNDLRYELYIKLCGTKTNLPSLAILPPTSAAAEQHSYRVYLQVQQWLGHDKDPTEYGWRTADGSLKPNPTNLDEVPPELKRKLSCKCAATGCGPSCPCRKRGAFCDSFCDKCKGETCKNAVEASASGGEDDWGTLLD